MFNRQEFKIRVCLGNKKSFNLVFKNYLYWDENKIEMVCKIWLTIKPA